MTGVAARRDHGRKLIAFARQLRKAPTDAEQKLWSLLRRGKLDGYHFRRQVPMAGYIVDFCCLSAGLGIEADGGQHSDPGAREYDQGRSRELAAQSPLHASEVSRSGLTTGQLAQSPTANLA